MSGSVDRRVLREVSGVSVRDDEPATWSEADKLAGCRLDRRRRYLIIDNEVHAVAEWTGPCSGCSDSEELGSPPDRGSGCGECGYTGKRRMSHWMPIPEGPNP